MSKKQLFKDNILVFLGANFANGLNYLLNIFLKRTDDHIFNLYTVYSSVSLLLLVPSLVAMRTFTVFGDSPIANIKRSIAQQKNKVFIAIICFCLLLLPFDYFLTRYTEAGTWVTSLLLILIAIVGFIANIFRGIKQNEEDFKIAVISLNIEACGRLILGFIFAIPLNMGISGILLGHVLGLIGSLLICFDRKYVNEEVQVNDEISLRNVFITSTLMTLGLEFISNFDIIYSNYVLKDQEVAQTEFNTMQFFRKIIFFGIFGVSSVILSFGSKNKHSKKFSFLFTLGTGLVIGIGLGTFFYLIKGIIFAILKGSVTLITPQNQILFLLATTLMSTSYLLSNWLFTLKKKMYIYIPLIISTVQTVLFLLFGKELFSLLQTFLATSILFFIITISAGLVEVINERKKGEIATYDTV